MARLRHSAVLEEVGLARTSLGAALGLPGPASTIYRFGVLALSRVSLATEPTDNTALAAVMAKEVAAASA